MSALSIPDVTLRDNNSQRLPCILVLDASASMSGDPIGELNGGLKILEGELKRDDIASQRVQLLVIKFGGDDDVEIMTDWTDAMDFAAPQLRTNGRSPMGKAVQVALTKLEEQKARYRANGINYNRPWLFLITDGEPTDDQWQVVAEQSRAAEEAGRVTVYAIGVGPDANLEKLANFSTRVPARLEGLKFRELFIWLSQSASTASKAALGANVQLALPTSWMQAPG